MVDDLLERLARAAAAIAHYCDHAEHLEEVERTTIAKVGRDLRDLAVESATGSASLIESYRARLDAVERRHPLFPVEGFAAAEVISDETTWRQLQDVQWQHDRHYHPDVFGLSRYEQLRHYALHLSKLAGAAADARAGQTAGLERRAPDVLLFGIELATLIGESLPDERIGAPLEDCVDGTS